MLKIKLHSVTDLITNSSTVIFTYSEESIKLLKDMINEILKTFDIQKTCDDMFDVVVLCDDSERYSEYIEKLKEDDVYELPAGVTEETDIDELWRNVSVGKLPKPKWFNDVEQEEDEWNYFQPSTYLYLIPKEKQYQKVGELIKKFLYSTNHEATRD